MEFIQWWQGLDPLAQAMLLGMAASALVGLAKWIPWVSLSPAEAKMGLVIFLAGIGGYANASGEAGERLIAGVLAALAALGAYGVYRDTVGKRLFKKDE